MGFLLLFSSLTLFRLSPFLSRLQWPAEQSFCLWSPVPLICSPNWSECIFLKFISDVSFPAEVFCRNPPHLMNKAWALSVACRALTIGPFAWLFGSMCPHFIHGPFLPDYLQLLEYDTLLCLATCTSFVCRFLLLSTDQSLFIPSL